METKDRYHVAIDGMRILAILAVVCIHATTRILEASVFDLQAFSITLFLNQASRFAVPLFFMISGFVLEVNYPFHLSYASYLKKRLSRIFLPYLFWSTMYYFFVYKQHAFSFFQSLLDGSASYQLYFIPTLLIFYILFPFVHSLYRFITNKWILAVLGIAQVTLLIGDYYLHAISLFYPLAIALLNYYVFLLGMIAAHHHKLLFAYVSRWKWVLLSFLGALALFIFIEGKTLYLQTHNYLFFYSQWRPSILPFTLLVFSLSYVVFNNLTKYEKLIHAVSRLSFFVFFIHVALLECMWQLFGKNLFQYVQHSPIQQLWFDPLFFLSITITSYAIAYVTHKIPYMTRISG